MFSTCLSLPALISFDSSERASAGDSTAAPVTATAPAAAPVAAPVGPEVRQSLKAMFPGFDDEIISAVLHSAGSVEAAIEQLLQMS